ncbi:MAG: CHAT domain-containing protein [Magnetococcales bacterium]|nr:CHAT domain-containing protein [Magnetococcales bacterium]
MVNQVDTLLTITLPEARGNTLNYKAGGQQWSKILVERLPEKEAHAAVLWQNIYDNWNERRDILPQVGAALGAWLLDSRAIGLLKSHAEGWRPGMNLARVFLKVPAHLADVAWEVTAVEGLGFLAIHQAFTLVRCTEVLRPLPQPLPGPVALEVIAVKHKATNKWSALQTDLEAKRIHEVITEAGWSNRLQVLLDPEGHWQHLDKLYANGSLPAILHFAGHGMENGSGLVFQGEDGGPREIEAARLAALLSSPGFHGQRVRCVFLNACHGAANGKARVQPFGGVGRQLIASGIPMVAALLAPVADLEARDLAGIFYGQVASGQPLDAALQTTRRHVFLNLDQSFAWPFLCLTAAGPPEPIWIESQGSGGREPSAAFLRFGFPGQWQRLERFLDRRTPMVVIVNGERHAGHRHLLRRFQYELAHYPGKTRYLVVRNLGLSRKGGEPRLARGLLLGALAKAFELDDRGPEEQVVRTIAQAMASACTNDVVLVVDMEEVLELVDAAWSQALLLLIHQVWVEVVGQAAQSGADLPVYLLISVGWPPEPAENNPKKTLMMNHRQIGMEAIAWLRKTVRLDHGIRVETLPELPPIDENYVAGYLEDILEMDPQEAERHAGILVGTFDNKIILEGVERLMNERAMP